MKKNIDQKGVSLLELLVALAISIIVISGVLSMVSYMSRNSAFLRGEAEMQETINFVGDRLGFVFRESFSSVCGNMDEMLAEDRNATSSLKKAYTMVSGVPTPQEITNILVPITPAMPTRMNRTIRAEEFPFLVVGKQGEPTPTVGSGGVPYYTLLNDIVPDSEFFITYELSSRMILKPGTGVPVDGISSSSGFIETSDIPSRLVGKKRIPFVITDCYQGDMFISDSTERVKKNKIPLGGTGADTVYFSGSAGYKEESTVIAPVEMYAYYLARPDPNKPPILRKRNMSTNYPSSLVDGVSDLKYEWGLSKGASENFSVQAYVSTEDILNSGMKMSDLSDSVVNVRVQITVEDVEDVASEKTAVRTFTFRNRMWRF